MRHGVSHIVAVAGTFSRVFCRPATSKCAAATSERAIRTISARYDDSHIVTVAGAFDRVVTVAGNSGCVLTVAGTFCHVVTVAGTFGCVFVSRMCAGDTQTYPGDARTRDSNDLSVVRRFAHRDCRRHLATVAGTFGRAVTAAGTSGRAVSVAAGFGRMFVRGCVPATPEREPAKPKRAPATAKREIRTFSERHDVLHIVTVAGALRPSPASLAVI